MSPDKTLDQNDIRSNTWSEGDSCVSGPPIAEVSDTMARHGGAEKKVGRSRQS
jgi:hypothetical protein